MGLTATRITTSVKILAKLLVLKVRRKDFEGKTKKLGLRALLNTEVVVAAAVAILNETILLAFKVWLKS